MTSTAPHHARARATTDALPARRAFGDPATLIALAVILAGVAWGTWLLAPHPPGDASSEAGFARDMSVHHAQAVEMALIVRDRTQDAELISLTTDMILTQQAQIGQTQGWLAVWGLLPTGVEPPMAWMGHPVDGPMPGMASAEEIRRLREIPVVEAEAAFLRLMIHHHLSAVEMSEAALERTDRPEVTRLARSIVASQQLEIDAMQDLLERKGFDREPVAESHHPAAAPHGHGDGFIGSLSEQIRSTLRLLPVALAIFAATWLAVDTLRRRATSAGHALPATPTTPNWQAIAAVALLASGALHLGLAPSHFEEATSYGVFFTIAAIVEAIVAAFILARPSRAVYATGVGAAVALIIVYAVFRLVPPPGAESPETLDLIGVIAKLTELIAASACLWLWSQRDRRLATPAR